MATVTYTTTTTTTTPVFSPEFLESFSSKALNILSTNDRQTFNISANSANGLSQTYSISAVPSEDTPKARSFNGSLTSTYRGSEYNLSSVYYTDNTSGDEVTIQARNLAPGLRLGVSGFTRNPRLGYDAHVGSVNTTYETNQFAIQNQLFSDAKKHTLKTSASFGRFLHPTRNESLTLGASVQASYANSNVNLDSKDAGVTYRTDSLHATFETSDNMSTVSSTIAQRISPNTLIAAKLDAPLASLTSLPGYPRALSLGVSSDFSDFSLRANANLAEGTISTTYSRSLFNSLYRCKVPGSIAVSLRSSLNKGSINSASAIDKVGVQLNYGDY